MIKKQRNSFWFSFAFSFLGVLMLIMSTLFVFLPKANAQELENDISYPLSITLTVDKERIKSDGNDVANLSIKILDSRGMGVKDVNISLKDMADSSDIILPPSGITDINGEATFKIKSLDEHRSTFQFSLRNDDVGEVYTSNSISLEFYDATSFRDRPEVKMAAAIAAPITIVSLILNLYSSIISLINSFLPFINYVVNLILQLFGIRKKEKPWGLVYDSMTKEPADLAIVRLFESKTNALKQTAVTDKSGRFGFQLEKGKYHVTVTKKSYLFPSKLIKGSSVDGGYHNLYFGGDMTIDPKRGLNISIPLDLATAVEAKIGRVDSIKNTFGKIALPVLLVSFLLSIFVLWVSTTLFNGVLCGLYFLTIVFRKRRHGKKTKPWGKVYDIGSGKPVIGVPIKIFDKKYSKLLETKVSDSEGKFSFLLPKGEYYIRLASFKYQMAPKNRAGDGNDNYFGDNFTVEENQSISFNIPVIELGKKPG